MSPMDLTTSVDNSLTRIAGIEKEGDDGLLVTFSDGTTAGYVVEELLQLRPLRELARPQSKATQPAPMAKNGRPKVADKST